MQKRQPSTRFIRMARRGAMATTALALLTAPGLGAQEADPQAEPELIAELQQVNEELVAIQQKALEEPKLQQEQAALEERVVSAMREVDPEAEGKLHRMQEIEGEMQSAHQEGDDEKLGSLVQEHQRIQQSLQVTQAQALQQEEVAEAVGSFRIVLLAAMKEVDPKTEELIQRQEAIQAELAEGEVRPGR